MEHSIVLLQVTYRLRPGMRDAFVQTLAQTGLLDRIRGEVGCIQYEYFNAREDADKLLLIEQWQSQAALDAHQAMPHMAQLKQLKPQFVLDTLLIRTEL